MNNDANTEEGKLADEKKPRLNKKISKSSDETEETSPARSTSRRRGGRGRSGKLRSNSRQSSHIELPPNDAGREPSDSSVNDTPSKKKHDGESNKENAGEPPKSKKKRRKKPKRKVDQSEEPTAAEDDGTAATSSHKPKVAAEADKSNASEKDKTTHNEKANDKANENDNEDVQEKGKKNRRKRRVKKAEVDSKPVVEKPKRQKPTGHKAFGGVTRNRQRHWTPDSSLPVEITQFSYSNRSQSRYSDNWRQPEPADRPLALVTDDGEVDYIHFVDCHEPEPYVRRGDRVLAEYDVAKPATVKTKSEQCTLARETKMKANPVGTEADGRTKSSRGRVQEPPHYVHRDDQVHGNRRPLFTPYLSPEEIQIGLKSGVLKRGLVRVNKRNRSEAYVTADDLSNDILVFGQRDQNRTLDGDIVAVRLVDVEKVWALKKENMIRKAEARRTNGAERVGARDEELEKSKPKYCGEVVGIIDRQPNQVFAGILHLNHPSANRDPKEDGKTSRLAWFKPTDKRVPFIAIPLNVAPPDIVSNAKSYETHILTACISRWPIDALRPFGQVVSFLGPVGTIPAEAQAILVDNAITDKDFPKQAIQNLPKTPWKIPASEYTKRRDLRETRIFTIDPATAKDLDDAVHVIKLDDGNYEVGVHIADVSFFVRNHGALDKEARKRGTSTYLVDRVIPMLPSLLCEELCSLNPGVERLAFSVIWKMDAEGHILDTWFGRTIIKSCAKLAYEDAQNVIDGKGLPETLAYLKDERAPIEENVMTLYKLSKHMRKRRFDNGALTVGSIRLSFQLGDDGEPKDVWVYELKEANRLIEEFMLCANISIAQKISSTFPDEALLRRHDVPNERRLDEFVKLAESLGYYLDGSSAGNLQDSLNAIEDKHALSVLILLAIKPMQRAKYFCTGVMDISQYRHYALNVPLYTHFTSPIRRYADVIVHRMLEAAIQGKDTCGYSKEDVKGISDDCNRNSDNARNAQDQSIELYLARYLYNLEQAQGPIIRTAVVVGVIADAFDVMVPEFGIEKRIYTKELPLHSFTFDASSLALDVHWKKGEPVVSFSKGLEEDIGSPKDADVEKIAPQPSIPIVPASAIKSLPDENIDPSSCLQQFKVFTKFDVILQTNIHRTPPIVNVYPINPFADRP